MVARLMRFTPSDKSSIGWMRMVHLSFFFSSRRRHTRCSRDWSSDVCSSDLPRLAGKRVDAGAITELLHAVLAPGDRVCLEGNNQKQADFLAGALVQLDPQQVHDRSEEHTSELQSRLHLVCRLLLEKKKTSHH